MKIQALITVIVLSAISCGYGITNGGFETGDFTGWTLNNAGPSSVVTSAQAADLTVYNPVDGNYFAQLSAGGGQGVYTLVSQGFSLTAGSSLTGYAAFLAQDYLPFNDDAFVNILDSSNNLVATVWSASVGTVGNFGRTPWQGWSWTALTSGSYFVEFGIANQGDNQFSSVGLLDAVHTPDGGTTVALLGIALAGIGVFGRKKMTAVK